MTNGGPASSTALEVPGLREYALVADGQRGAVLGPDGNVVWMCAPRWHDDAVFSTLVGGGGRYSITPVGRYTWGGVYESGALVWRSRWVTDDAVIESREALAMPADPHRVVLLRRVRAVEGTGAVQVRLDVRGNFGGRSMRELRRHDDGAWLARTGDLRVRWTCAADVSVENDGALICELRLEPGSTCDLVLEISDEPLPDPVGPPELWDATEAAWRQHVPELADSAAPRDAALAGAVLRGLTRPGGGMVAAATASLPEHADTDRSYDYRYAWIRDQCYAGIAAAAAGMDSVLDDAVGFVVARILEHGADLRPAYTIDGGAVPDQHQLDLPGYPGGQVRLGNWVNRQFQLDSLGEVLRLIAAAARADRLDSDGWRAALVAVGAIESRWTEPDAGIWELDADWWTQSRLACVAGLRDAAGVAPAGGDAGRFVSLADGMLAETTRTCLHPDGYWQRSPTNPGTDASLVWPAVCGALSAGDPRTRATLAAVERDLVVDGYAFRFRPDGRPLGEAEGSFLLCGFMLSMAHLDQGDVVSAARWFERNRAACGSPGLFTEEYDVTERELRGNLPQAFVHALFLESATRLAEVDR